MRPPRVLHAPLNIANDPWCLSRAERGIGLESDLAVVRENPFAPDADIDLGDRTKGPVGRNLAKLQFTRAAMKHYDIFHYSFATSILDYRRLGLALLDLGWASRSGLAVMTFHGCDVRALQPGGCNICTQGCGDTVGMRRRYEKIRRLAHVMCVKTPDLLDAVAGAHFIPQAVDVEAIPVVGSSPSRRIRFVHAATSRQGKGTEMVVSAIRRLQASGCDVELDVVEGVTRKEALVRYSNADVAIGQFRAGWYGVFEIEAMAMGKPVVGWVEPRYLELAGMTDVPIVNARLEKLEDMLRDLCDGSRLAEVGAVSRRYVESVHAAPVIARRMAVLYQTHWSGRNLLWPV